MARNNIWTAEEDEILRRYYPTEHGAVSARLPGRSKGACRARASLLGIACKMESKSEIWDDMELRILEEFYPSEGAKVIERLPGRSIAACRQQAAAMGIRYADAWTDEEVKTLSEFFPEEGSRVCRRIPGRTAAACYTRARLLGLQYCPSKKYDPVPVNSP